MRKHDSIDVLVVAVTAVVLWIAPVAAEATPSNDDPFFSVRATERNVASATIRIRWHLHFADAEGMGEYASDTHVDDGVSPLRLAPTPRGSDGIRERRKPFSLPSHRIEPGGDTLFKVLGASLFVVAAGDLASTEVGLRRGGFVETNPVLRHRATRISAHAAVPALIWWLTERSRRSGSEKLALWMRIGVTVAYGYATIHNARTINQTPVR